MCSLREETLFKHGLQRLAENLGKWIELTNHSPYKRRAPTLSSKHFNLSLHLHGCLNKTYPFRTTSLSRHHHQVRHGFQECYPHPHNTSRLLSISLKCTAWEPSS